MLVQNIWSDMHIFALKKPPNLFKISLLNWIKPQLAQDLFSFKNKWRKLWHYMFNHVPISKHEIKLTGYVT